jgi:hypothetical protein
MQQDVVLLRIANYQSSVVNYSIGETAYNYLKI